MSDYAEMQMNTTNREKGLLFLVKRSNSGCGAFLQEKKKLYLNY